MPKYRPAARIRRGKTASETCICARVVTGSYLRTWAILDQGPIDICYVETHTNRLQSIPSVSQPHGPARGDIPPPPRPQSPRAVEAGARFFSIGLESNASSRSCDAKLPAWEFTRRLVQRLTCLTTLVRTVHPAQKT